MQINSINQTNFEGGFRFRNMPVNLKETLPELIKNRRQIFNDFENPGDVFYLVRDSADYKVMKFIQNNKLKFEYYPEISTKSGMDTEKPEELSKLIRRIKQNPITTTTQLKKAVNINTKASRIKSADDENIEKILKTLKLEFKEYKITTLTNKCKILTDSETGKKVWISPPSKNGINYVFVEPKSLDFNTERYAIANDGKILARFCNPDQITQFKKNFAATLAKKK